MGINESNMGVFNDDKVVDIYAAMSGLTGAEKYIFERYIPRGARVLELGVGAGRCTAGLSRDASSYVAIDYADEMVRACRKRFPKLDFRTQDASDLSAFGDASFDAVVFAFNGIDYLHPVNVREKCLRECARVLAPNGHFIYSTHNPRMMLKVPDFTKASLPKAAWRAALAARETLQQTTRALKASAFWTGSGYADDGRDAELICYRALPKHARGECARAGFRCVETVGCFYPRKFPLIATSAYYFVMAKSGQ